MGVLFDTFPPVLQLHLKRFDYDYDRDMQIKARCLALNLTTPVIKPGASSFGHAELRLQSSTSLCMHCANDQARMLVGNVPCCSAMMPAEYPSPLPASHRVVESHGGAR